MSIHVRNDFDKDGRRLNAAVELIDPIQSWHKKSCLSHGYNFPCARIHPPSTRYPTSLWSEDHQASLSGKVRSKPTSPAPARTAPSKRMFDVSSAGSAKSTLKRRHRACGHAGLYGVH